MSINQAKQQMRLAMRTNLKTISKEKILSESRDITKKLIQSAQYKSAQNIAVYCSTPYEVQTHDIICDIFLTGKSCFIPYCSLKDMHMVKLTTLEEYSGLPLNKFQIREPIFQSDKTFIDAKNGDGLDMIIMPGLAFNRKRERLGHGKGFYDKYLCQMKDWCHEKGRPMPFTVALCLTDQLLDQIHCDENDQKPKMLLTCHDTIE